jgi:hypothetical protein
MQKKLLRKEILCGVFLLVLVASSIPSGNSATSQLQVGRLLAASVDFRISVAQSQLRYGMQLKDWDWALSDPNFLQKVSALQMGVIRIFVHDFEPAIRWSEDQNAGTYDWSRFDKIVNTILNLSAEPLLVVGGTSMIPEGMISDYQGTGFPSARSFGRYTADIAAHVKSKGWSIRYWELWNEPPVARQDQIVQYTNFFNAAQASIHEVAPDALIGPDRANYPFFYDYFADHAVGVGFLSFHRYIAEGTWLSDPQYYYDNATVMWLTPRLDTANWKYAGTDKWGRYYSPQEIRKIWYDKHGALLPVILSETNLNSSYEKGTDPRIQTIFGACWYSEQLRAAIMNGTDSSIYYLGASNDAPRWNIDKPTRGLGFGALSHSAPYSEWYPYWAMYLIGRNLQPGDTIFKSSSDDTSISVLAWRHGSAYNILIISKTPTPKQLNLSVAGMDQIGQVTLYNIDGSYSGIRSATSQLPFVINIQGYTVLLVQVN